MARRHYINNAPQQTLSAGITNTATSLSVASFTGWPSSFPFYATLELGTASEEIVSVTAITGTTATVVRAQDGSAAVSHNAGATLDFTVVAADFDEANAHVNATTGVHGVSGSVVGTSDVQTLTNKSLTAPTLTGTANGATLHLTGDLTAATLEVSGNETVGGTLAVTGTASTGALTSSSVHSTGTAQVDGTLTSTGAASLNGGATTTTFHATGTGQVDGTLTTAAITASGAITAPTVTGVLVPKQFSNQAAAGTGAAGQIIWLTAPTGTNNPVGIYTWNVTAGVWVPILPSGKCYLQRATNVGVGSTSSYSLIGPDTSNFATAGQMTVAGFQVNYAGVYLVNGEVAFPSNSTGQRGIGVGVNSVLNTASEVIIDAAGTGVISIPGQGFLLTCAAGDTINLFAMQTSGTTLNVSAVLTVEQYSYAGA